MGISFKIERKFTVNGKEYNSIDEVPEDVRKTIGKAMTSADSTGFKIESSTIRTRINFNGKEYESVEEMPSDIRELYQKVMKCAADVALPAGIIPAGKQKDDSEQNVTGVRTTGGMRISRGDEPFFSTRTFAISAVLTAIVMLIYYLSKNR